MQYRMTTIRPDTRALVDCQARFDRPVGFNNHVEYSRQGRADQVSGLVGTPTSGDQHHIHDAPVVVTPKSDAPVTDSKPPLTGQTLERTDVARWKSGNRIQKTLPFLTWQPLQSLHNRRADSDPPRPRAQPRSSLRACSRGMPGSLSASWTAACALWQPPMGRSSQCSPRRDVPGVSAFSSELRPAQRKGPGGVKGRFLDPKRALAAAAAVAKQAG